ncbi:hypothetical protein R3P38DRAFT_2829089 [Favolaschia claudopus]|uniref:F-box domain-containing protein n=1 Tax=Favolaschia claudopus TaxID=2862362 RepID=A0AAW0E9L3_9AGAR
MTIPHFPTEISLIHRRPSRRKPMSGVTQDDTQVDSACIGELPGGTIFASLPVELRVEIFRHFCGTFCSLGTVTEGPTFLLRVCRVWAELVLQTPQLWNSFTLHWPMPGPSKATFLIHALRTFISRSRNLPLSFALRYPVPVDPTCTEVMHCILPTLSRWLNVTIYAPTASLIPLWHFETSNSPCLTSFTMETFGPSPVVLRGLRFDWVRVTELDLFLIPVPTLDECRRVLAEAVSLRRCSLNATCVLTSDELAPLYLPKLEHLQLKLYRMTISDSPHLPFLTFLHSLTTPRLQSLKLSWNATQPAHWSTASSNKLVEFLEKQGEHLDTLNLRYLPLDAQQILRCLEVVPDLKSLNIALVHGDRENDIIDNDFLQSLALNGSGHGRNILPMLQSIRLESHGEGFGNEALLRLIASRWKYQDNLSAGQLESMDILSPTRHAEYRPRWFKDVWDGRIDVAAALKSEFTMMKVLECFLNEEEYDGKSKCFMNHDFPVHIRSLLVFDH